MRLLLDENLSPSIMRRRTIDEARILVTINERDFVKLAGREELHGGLVTLPFGTTRDEQFALVVQAMAALGAQDGGGMNIWLRIGLDGSIELAELPPLG